MEILRSSRGGARFGNKYVRDDYNIRDIAQQQLYCHENKRQSQHDALDDGLLPQKARCQQACRRRQADDHVEPDDHIRQHSRHGMRAADERLTEHAGEESEYSNENIGDDQQNRQDCFLHVMHAFPVVNMVI